MSESFPLISILIGLVGGTWVLLFYARKYDGYERYISLAIVFLGYGMGLSLIVMGVIDHLATLLLFPIVFIIFFLWIKTPKPFFEKHLAKYFPLKNSVSVSEKIKRDKTHELNYTFDKISDYSQEDIQLIVGKRYKKYLNKWRKMEQTNKQIAINWPALLFSIFWFAYRKMWKFPLLILSGLYILAFYKMFTGNRVEPSMIFILLFMPGIFSYTAYQTETLKKLNKIKQHSTSGDEQKELMEKQGGTSWLNVFLLIGIIIIIEIISIVITGIISSL